MIVYCPNCHQPGRIASDAVQEVECPHCFSRFNVEPISGYDNSIVTFRNVDQSADQISLPDSNDYDLDASAALLEPLSTDEQTTLEPLDLTSEVHGHEKSETAATAAPPLKFSLESKPSTKARKKEKSAIGSMIGVVLGGFASLPIATAIMWYGMGKDPFQVGPKVAQYVPWIVPDRFAGRYGSSSRSFPPMTSNGSTSYFTDDSLKKQQDDSVDFGSNLSDANSGTNSPSAQKPLDEIQRSPNANASQSAVIPAEVTMPSEVKSDEPSIASTGDSSAAELPFKPDSESQPLNADLIQYQLNVVKSIDELSAESDSLAFGKFLDDLQLLLNHLDSSDASVLTQPQLSGLSNTLDSIKTAPFLKGLVTESRLRLTKSSGEATEAISYVDVFELKNTTAIDSIDALSEFADDYEVWLPTDNTKEPVRSLKVLCPIGVNQGTSSQNSRYILIGQVKKTEGIENKVFLVQFVVPL